MQSGFRRDFLSCIVGVGLLFAHAVLPYLSCQAVKLSLGEAHRLPASRLPSDLTSGEVPGRLAAPLKLLPNGGHVHMSCFVPETFGNGDRTTRVGSVWLRVVVERRLPRPQGPLPFSRGFSERQQATKTGELGQHVTKRSQASIRLLHA